MSRYHEIVRDEVADVDIDYEALPRGTVNLVCNAYAHNKGSMKIHTLARAHQLVAAPGDTIRVTWERCRKCEHEDRVRASESFRDDADVLEKAFNHIFRPTQRTMVTLRRVVFYWQQRSKKRVLACTGFRGAVIKTDFYRNYPDRTVTARIVVQLTRHPSVKFPHISPCPAEVAADWDDGQPIQEYTPPGSTKKKKLYVVVIEFPAVDPGDFSGWWDYSFSWSHSSHYDLGTQCTQYCDYEDEQCHVTGDAVTREI